MKYFFKIALLLFLPLIGWTQNTVVNITPEKFSKEYDSYAFGDVSGWIFHQGNDTSWAKKDIDLSGWEAIKPTELSLKYADSTGKVEAWFRVKIKLDSSLGNKLSGVNLGSWAASDLYINGELVTSNGNTSTNGNHFREGTPYEKLSYHANLKAGEVYTIAVHFIDYKSTLPPSQLRSLYFLKNIISITGPKYDSYVLENIKQNSIFSSISISVLFILSLLFWILFIQNPTEKNLRLIAYGTTGLTIAYFSIFQLQHASANYNAYEIWILVNAIFSSGTIILILLIIVNIFKRKVTKALKSFIAISFIVLLATNFIPLYLNEILSLIFTALFFLICIYYIVSSWRNLKGAQWAVVAGLFFFLLLLLALYIIRALLVGSLGHYFIRNLLPTILSLSFPISLLVYVSMRFKEVIAEVQQNGNRVLQLSEEKKEQALYQQKILEAEVARQTGEIRQTLENLKSTQSQLIQSEKMASLGELTAGIAHEIQNPLNFVNNFSEVNMELLAELKDEIINGNLDEVNAIADDVISNEEKINHHGKRADAIVKGMLQHSQSSGGVKEPTAINALADEYLRLAYHGLRAKDKGFNASFETQLDETIGMVNIQPQEIGRVILNLINNAFYAVAERKRNSPEAYDPKVTVTTKKKDNTILIIVKDNGTGIPQKVVDKIFQPFFTTKPTGQGTGLGLSLSYDIVKAHGGELKVETTEEEGSSFTICMPA
ncbi:ATP-binding protein [Sediminibacterium sp.]|uniref:sensor histidine kinase n=1 Tax=Sediminibacterium sp. TaxID=1917865 RepID=UPI0025F361BD|nr:ATP-binding protein [Sediminibacterium sp.]